MRYVLLLLSALLIPTTVARADVSISIGINVPVYPTLVRVPGYPAYYDPRMDANYFFYDGLYWVFWGDNWYASSWYNGPWQFVDPYYMPVFVLSIPVRYYRYRPHYFHGWHEDRPPHWGEHWGGEWEHHRSGWDRWDRHSAPAPAPLPSYQREYRGDRYPREIERQESIRAGHYRYEPRDEVSRQHFQRAAQPADRVQRERRVDRGQPERQVDRQVDRERQHSPSQQSPSRPQQQQQRRPPDPREQRSRNPGVDRDRGGDRGGENSPVRQDSRRDRPPAHDNRGAERPSPASPRQVPPREDRGNKPRPSGKERDEKQPDENRGERGRDRR
ncbi:MAG: hypothetical protein WC809_01005 [Sinimarinibacterium sp.]|jgi:hypothetical protein